MADRLLLLLTLSALLSLASASASPAPSLPDLLRAHGLPAGLLPRSISSFSWDPPTGLLSVRLDRPCLARYETAVHFDREVTGNLTFGGLKSLKGLSQEELFVWLPVKEIVVEDPTAGVVLIDIGVAHKQISVSVFEDPPECRPDEGGDYGTKEAGFQAQR